MDVNTTLHMLVQKPPAKPGAIMATQWDIEQHFTLYIPRVPAENTVLQLVSPRRPFLLR